MHTLTITLVKALDLPASDFGLFGIGGKSDPYFTFKVGAVTHKSTVVYSTLTPTWSPPETFTFEIRDPRAAVLEVQAFDYDRFNKDDFLGRVSLSLFPFLERKTAEVQSYDLELSNEFSKHKKRSVVFLEIKLESTDGADKILELWENERYHIIRKWTSETFLPTDRKHWSAVGDANSSSESFEKIAPAVPEGMECEGWTLDVSQGDANGWIYAPSFQGPWQKEHFALALVRRRKWINKCRHIDNNQSSH